MSTGRSMPGGSTHRQEPAGRTCSRRLPTFSYRQSWSTESSSSKRNTNSGCERRLDLACQYSTEDMRNLASRIERLEEVCSPAEIIVVMITNFGKGEIKGWKGDGIYIARDPALASLKKPLHAELPPRRGHITIRVPRYCPAISSCRWTGNPCPRPVASTRPIVSLFTAKSS